MDRCHSVQKNLQIKQYLMEMLAKIVSEEQQTKHGYNDTTPVYLAYLIQNLENICNYNVFGVMYVYYKS